MTQITTTKKPAIVGTATAITIFRFDDDDDEDDDDGDQDDTDGDDDNDDGVGEKLAALRFSFVSGNREVFVSGDDKLFSENRYIVTCDQAVLLPFLFEFFSSLCPSLFPEKRTLDRKSNRYL